MKLIKFSAIFAILGLIIAIATSGNLRLFISGKTVNLADPISEFNDKALSEGTINFVYGPFAILETTQKTYGIETSKRETNYYIVGDIENGEGFAVFSTGDTALSARLNSASDQWIEYFTDEKIADDEQPVINISYKGKLADMSQTSDFQQYLDEAKTDLAQIGIGYDEYASLMIVEGEVGIGDIALFIVGTVMFLLGLAVIIIVFIKTRRQRSSEDYY